MRSTSNTIAIALLFTTAMASSAFAVRQVHTGKAVAAVTVVTENEITFIGSTSFQNLAGANTTITVPAGKVQLVEAEFTADSTSFSCNGASGEPSTFPQSLATAQRVMWVNQLASRSRANELEEKLEEAQRERLYKSYKYCRLSA